MTIVRSYCDRGDLFCFPGEINQVFMNVIANSVDAMAGQGTLEIVTTRDARAFRVIVRDDGPGIDPAVRERVFEPFFTTKEPGAGTGLGLSISYAIVQRHGGTIEIGDNPAGRGAEVSVALPVDLAEGARERSA